MKKTFCALLSICMLPLPMSARAESATKPHSHANHVEEVLQLNDGKKWETDKSLRDGMNRIQQLLESSLPEIHSRRFTDEKYVTLSNEVSAALSSIFKHCKLGEKADAMLHVLLAQIMDGSQKLKSAGDAKVRTQGVMKITEALEKYPRYFNHPGWRPSRSVRLRLESPAR